MATLGSILSSITALGTIVKDGSEFIKNVIRTVHDVMFAHAAKEAQDGKDTSGVDASLMQ